MIKKIAFALFLLNVYFSIFAQNNQVPELRFNEKGTFKIVQVTDIHYVINSSESQKSIRLIIQSLDQEKPDLVVFTGDIITCKPQKKGWDEVLETAISRQIPYAVILGNHDDEHDWTRDQIYSYLATKPYCLAQKGPEYLKGVGNYVLQIKGKNQQTNALLYFLDTNAYNKISDQKGYDWLGFDQVGWYRKTSVYFTKENKGVPYPALAFFHIPLQEYTLLIDSTKNYVRNAPVFGQRTEKECAGILNTGLFAAFVESGDVMGTFCGHDHNNDYIGLLNNVCLAYGRFSGSKTTYTDIGSGTRIIELKESQRTFDTWIRTSDNEIRYKITYPNAFRK